MYEHIHEREQVEQLKAFWRQYGNSILLGIVLAIVLSGLIQYWRKVQMQHAELAAISYQQLILNARQHNHGQTEQVAGSLMKDYPKTPYASLAAMVLASQAIERENLDLAAQQLRWVVERSPQKILRQVARLRLARVEIALKHPEKAVDLLKVVEDKNYQAEIDMLKAQALLASNQPATARQQYQKALLNFPTEAVLLPVLQMKVDDLNQPEKT